MTYVQRTTPTNKILWWFTVFEYDPQHEFDTIIRPDIGYNFKARGSE